MIVQWLLWRIRLPLIGKFLLVRMLQPFDFFAQATQRFIGGEAQLWILALESTSFIAASTHRINLCTALHLNTTPNNKITDKCK